MPTAEVISIGTEILLGEILDTNTRHIARALRAVGVDVYRTGSVGDNRGRIARRLTEALDLADMVLATGGLGPTVDDVSREGIADAVGQSLVFIPELWIEVQAMYRRFGREAPENNRRQAYIPAGAIPISNPVGTAPAFIVETNRGVVIALPGVPREMEYLLDSAVLPYLRRRFRLDSVIQVRVLHTAGVGESLIDEALADLEQWSNPTVGLAAHAGQVDLRLTAKAPTPYRAAKLLGDLEAEIRRRLGGMIYGADGDRLEDAALAALDSQDWRLAVIEAGLGGLLIQRLAMAQFARRVAGEGLGTGGGESPAPRSPSTRILAAGLTLPTAPEAQQLAVIVDEFRHAHDAQVGLGAALYPERSPRVLNLVLLTPAGRVQRNHSFGGHPKLDPRRGTHLALDTLRRLASTDGPTDDR